MSNHGRCCTCPNCAASRACSRCGSLASVPGQDNSNAKTPQYLCVEFQFVCPCKCNQCFQCEFFTLPGEDAVENIGYKIVSSPLHGYTVPDHVIPCNGQVPIGAQRCTGGKEGCCVKTERCDDCDQHPGCCYEVFQTVTLKQNEAGSLGLGTVGCSWSGVLNGLMIRTYPPASTFPEGNQYGLCQCGPQSGGAFATPCCPDPECPKFLTECTGAGICGSPFTETCTSFPYNEPLWRDICLQIQISATKLTSLDDDVNVAVEDQHEQADWAISAWATVYNIYPYLEDIPQDIREAYGDPVSLVPEETWLNIQEAVERRREQDPDVPTLMDKTPKTCTIPIFSGEGPGCGCTQDSGAIVNDYECPPRTMDPMLSPCVRWGSHWEPCAKSSAVPCWKCVPGTEAGGDDTPKYAIMAEPGAPTHGGGYAIIRPCKIACPGPEVPCPNCLYDTPLFIAWSWNNIGFCDSTGIQITCPTSGNAKRSTTNPCLWECYKYCGRNPAVTCPDQGICSCGCPGSSGSNPDCVPLVMHIQIERLATQWKVTITLGQTKVFEGTSIPSQACLDALEVNGICAEYTPGSPEWNACMAQFNCLSISEEEFVSPGQISNCLEQSNLMGCKSPINIDACRDCQAPSGNITNTISPCSVGQGIWAPVPGSCSTSQGVSVMGRPGGGCVTLSCDNCNCAKDCPCNPDCCCVKVDPNNSNECTNKTKSLDCSSCGLPYGPEPWIFTWGASCVNKGPCCCNHADNLEHGGCHCANTDYTNHCYGCGLGVGDCACTSGLCHCDAWGHATCRAFSNCGGFDPIPRPTVYNTPHLKDQCPLIQGGSMALCPDECGTSASGYVRPALTCAVATDNSGRCPVNFQKVASVNYDPCTGDFSFGVSLPCCCTTCNGGGAQIPASLGGNIQGSGPGCIHNISGVVGPGCSSAGDSCDSNATNCGGGTCGVNCPGSCLDDCGCVFCVTDCFFGGTECFDTCGGKGVNVQATITFSLTVTPPPPGQGKHWS